MDMARIGLFRNTTDVYLGVTTAGELFSTTNDNSTDDVYLYDYGQNMQDEFLSNLHKHSATFYVILALWTFIINGIVILACTQNKYTRYDTYHTQIVNFSISSELIGVFVLPLTVYYIQQAWDLGEIICRIWIIADVLLPFVSMVILIHLSVSKLVTSSQSGFYSFFVRKLSRIVVILLPWILASVIVIPMWTVGHIPYTELSDHCFILVTSLAGILCPVLTYFVPLVIISILSFKLMLRCLQLEDSGITVSTIVSDRQARQCVSHSHVEGDSSRPPLRRQATTSTAVSVSDTQTKTDDLVALCIVNLVFTLLWFPYQCVSFLLALCNSQMCVPSAHVTQAITLIAATSSGLAPLCWFVNKQLRENICSCFQDIVSSFVANRNEELPSDMSGAEETFV